MIITSYELERPAEVVSQGDALARSEPLNQPPVTRRKPPFAEARVRDKQAVERIARPADLSRFLELRRR